ncbi:hypothetical protein MLD38_031858 [Melastoma candidum]|uniref:Uncharacterized protein n=1 Tax=Melastoma candidum TaxID=119954 RepID=A0ACB9MSR5_9MYRT|nr:hypothetical protein MLD38_031858 [Melastoma candidum]
MWQRELLEFRTPQHPSLGTNRWGGDSPLLARNVPRESLNQVYLRLTAPRTRDEVYPGADAEEYFESRRRLCDLQQDVPSGTPSHSRVKAFLSNLLMTPRRERGPGAPEEVVFGMRSRKRKWLRFKRWDHRKRWPQGW